MQHRISQKAVCMQILVRYVLLLLFVTGDTLQPSQRRDHGKQQVQFSVLLHVRLHKDGAFFRIEACRQKIQNHLQRIVCQPRGVVIISGKRVPVRHKEKTIMRILQAHPVLQCTHVVSEVQLAGGAHSAEDARVEIAFFICHEL